MDWFDLLAQGFGILGMVMNVLSYQFKKQRSVIIFQFFGSIFFAVNFFMLGAYMGSFLNAIGIIRAIVYANRSFFKAQKPIWIVLFTALFLLSYVLVFTVFEKEPTVLNFIIETLPLIAMTATTVSFSKKDAAIIRKLGLISSPCWLIYNCVNFAIGAVVCEVLTLISILTAFVRLDLKRKNINNN